MGGDVFHADFFENLHGFGEGERPHEVGGTGFLFFGDVGPFDFVEGDEVDRASSHGIRGGAVFETCAGADEAAAAEGGVHFVAAEDEEVDAAGVAGGAHGDGAVGHELSAIDEDFSAIGVGHGGDAADGGDVTGDVGRAGDGDHFDFAVVFAQFPLDVVDVERSVGGIDAGIVHASAESPGEKVRMVLHDGGENHIVVVVGDALAKSVDGVGGVGTEDDCVIVGVGADKARDDLAASIIGMRAEERLASGAAVDAGVPVGKTIDKFDYRAKRGGGGGVVEIDVAFRAAVEEGDLLVKAGENVVGVTGKQGHLQSSCEREHFPTTASVDLVLPRIMK